MDWMWSDRKYYLFFKKSLSKMNDHGLRTWLEEGQVGEGML